MEPAGRDPWKGIDPMQDLHRDKSRDKSPSKSRNEDKISPETIRITVYSSYKFSEFQDLRKLDPLGNIDPKPWFGYLEMVATGDIRKLGKEKVWVHAAMEWGVDKIRDLIRARFPYDKGNTFAAGRGGIIEVLEYLKKKRFRLDAHTCAGAAIGNKLEALQWLRKNNYPWDERVCDYAAKQGHLELLKWALENGAPFKREELLEYAKNQLDVLSWLNKNLS